MEMWLKGEKEEIRFPITPFFEIEKPWNNHEENLNMLGTVNIFGNAGLRTTEISSFFPHKDNEYTFLTFDDDIDPYDYVEKIEKMQESGKPIRFIVTETPHNFLVLIENFVCGESEEGGFGDVNFSLSLKEYIKVTAEEYEEEPTGESSLGDNLEGVEPPEEDDDGGKKYTIKKGDTLWDICKTFYGDPFKWTELYEKNKAVIGNNPHYILPGQVIEI